MIAFEILEAVTAYRSFERTAEMCGYSSLLSHWSRCHATDTLAELLAQPTQAALRSRVRDIGELVFNRGGLTEMHRIMRQLVPIAPDTVSVDLVNKWWKGVGAEGLYWTIGSYSAPPDGLNSAIGNDASIFLQTRDCTLKTQTTFLFGYRWLARWLVGRRTFSFLIYHLIARNGPNALAIEGLTGLTCPHCASDNTGAIKIKAELLGFL